MKIFAAVPRKWENRFFLPTVHAHQKCISEPSDTSVLQHEEESKINIMRKPLHIAVATTDS